MAPTSNSDDPAARRDALDRVSRRTVLRAGTALALPALAGCLGGDGGDRPDPVAVSDRWACDVCGMVIVRHPGPVGEIFFRDDSPGGHDNPARFCSVKQCMFSYYFEHEDLGWETAGVYVTDYSVVDYNLSAEQGTTYISSHTEAESFVVAQDAFFVVGADVYGAMGKDFVPFSEESDAKAFADDHGGDVLGFDDINPSLIAR